MPLTRAQENVVTGALPGPVGRQLIAMLNGGGRATNAGPAGPIVPPLINNTAPVYTAGTDYVETINGVPVTRLTIAAVRNFLGSDDVSSSQAYSCFSWRRYHSSKGFSAIY